jgi:hypothetical protein
MIKLFTSVVLCGIMAVSAVAQGVGNGECMNAAEAVKMLERAGYSRAAVGADMAGAVMVVIYADENDHFIMFTSDTSDNMCQFGQGFGYQAFKIGRAI